MMLQTNFSEEREAMIGRAVVDLVSELRLVDVEYLISFITLQMFNHVADQVASSAERFFTPGFITLGNGCNVSAAWDRPPNITIDLVMHLDWAKAYFSVILEAEQAQVQLNYFSSEIADGDPQENTRRLQRTIQENLI
ncbi:MAG: hypothetical protein WAT78_08615 [Rhizobiaceae bacterium]